MTDTALRAECAALEGFLEGLAPTDWNLRTDFFDWTVADEVMHLHQVDLFSLEAIQDPTGFEATVASVRAAQARGVELSTDMRQRFGHLSPAHLLATWRTTWTRLCEILEADDPTRRVPWFALGMSVGAMAGARQMEVWAHGQDIYDRLRVERVDTDRIHGICDLGVRTLSWSFRNRRETAPEVRPHVVLTSASGTRWDWNAPGSDRVEGCATDFALVVTQRRNVVDTGLTVEGPVATRWMQIAQCFAGPPATPPAPGTRTLHHGRVPPPSR